MKHTSDTHNHSTTPPPQIKYPHHMITPPQPRHTPPPKSETARDEKDWVLKYDTQSDDDVEPIGQSAV